MLLSRVPRECSRNRLHSRRLPHTPADNRGLCRAGILHAHTRRSIPARDPLLRVFQLPTGQCRVLPRSLLYADTVLSRKRRKGEDESTTRACERDTGVVMRRHPCRFRRAVSLLTLRLFI